MKTKALVSGAFGQIGVEFVPVLQAEFGQENVIALGHRNITEDFSGIVEKGDVTSIEVLRRIILKHRVNTVYHLASILSAKGEENPDLAWKVNMEGLKNVLDLAREYRLKVFWPSSIAVFGSTTPKEQTPQQTVLEPTTVYGITKLAGELLGQYYFLKHGVDIRSVRFPGIISYKAEPGGGTSDYAVAIFYEALRAGHYQCFVKPETTIPMMYMDDAIRAVMMIMAAEAEKIKIRTSYNLAAVSFSAAELAAQIKKRLPLTISYQPDFRQGIADSWPRSTDDSVARKDWDWQHHFGLAEITEIMIKNLKKKLGK